MTQLFHEAFDIPGRVFTRESTHPDGSCAFHSVAHCMNLFNYRTQSDEMKQRIGIAVRRRSVTKRNWQKFLQDRGFSEDLAPPLGEAQDPKAFADDFVLNYLGWLWDINLLVLVSPTEVYSVGNEDGPVILIAWLKDALHFESIVQSSRERIRCQVDEGEMSRMFSRIFRQLGFTGEQLVALVHWSTSPGDGLVGVFPQDAEIVTRLRSLQKS